MNHVMTPDWPAPAHIKACTTLRSGGFSLEPALLKKTLALPEEPIRLRQTHSTIALPATPENSGKEGDATYTQIPKRVCFIRTADCLPILLCNRNGTMVAAIHAGWRGLADGIIESTLAAMNLPGKDIIAWFGPAIGPNVFEVGEEVRERFLNAQSDATQAFIPSPNARWLANIYALARLRLERQGVIDIYGGQYCTFSDKELFCSYRRDGNQTGHMASLIYIDAD